MTLPRSGCRMLGLAVALLATLASGCRSTTEPVPDQRVVAGTYVLESLVRPISGPDSRASGTFVLTADGQATRRVQYRMPDGATEEMVAVGTFHLVSPDSIAFVLREEGGRSAEVWQIRAVRVDAEFSHRYPGPADGEVVETYRRQTP